MRGLNSTEVALLQCWFALSYVGSLYVVRAGRLAFGSEPRDASGKKPRSRDHPDVIRTRLIAVSLAALSSCFSVFAARWWIAGLEMKVTSCT